jgi:hypothetical protein
MSLRITILIIGSLNLSPLARLPLLVVISKRVSIVRKEMLNPLGGLIANSESMW